MADNGVTEPVVITPVFVDGLAGIEIDRHGLARLTLYGEQRDAYTGTMERVLVGRLILPREVLAALAGRMLAVASETPTRAPAALISRDLN